MFKARFLCIFLVYSPNLTEARFYSTSVQRLVYRLSVNSCCGLESPLYWFLQKCVYLSNSYEDVVILLLTVLIVILLLKLKTLLTKRTHYPCTECRSNDWNFRTVNYENQVCYHNPKLICLISQWQALLFYCWWDAMHVLCDIKLLQPALFTQEMPHFLGQVLLTI